MLWPGPTPCATELCAAQWMAPSLSELIRATPPDDATGVGAQRANRGWVES